MNKGLNNISIELSHDSYCHLKNNPLRHHAQMDNITSIIYMLKNHISKKKKTGFGIHLQRCVFHNFAPYCIPFNV